MVLFGYSLTSEISDGQVAIKPNLPLWTLVVCSRLKILQPQKLFQPPFNIITEVIVSIMFQKIPKGAQKEWTVASQKDLKPKNKFKNIYPCKQAHTDHYCFVSPMANDSVSLYASHK